MNDEQKKLIDWTKPIEYTDGVQHIPARYLGTLAGNHSQPHIVAVAQAGWGESIRDVRDDGKVFDNWRIRNKKTKVTRWVNCYNNGDASIHEDKLFADRYTSGRIKCIPIEFEID